MKTALFLALLLPATLAAQEQALSEQESQLMLDCIKNIDAAENLLSPVTAETCVNGLSGKEDLMDRAVSVYPKATNVLLYNNSLLGLRKVVDRYAESDLGYALARELEGPNCYPCQLGLGPRPEKLFPWVDRYLPDRSVTSRRALRTWTSLGEPRRSALLAEGMRQDAWNEQPIRTRYAKLSAMAEKDARELLGVGKKRLLKDPGLVGLAEELKQDLLVSKPPPSDAYRLRKELDDLLLEVEVLRGEGEKPEGRTAAETKEAQLKAAKERLSAARGEAGKKGFLDSAFDNYVPGAAPPPITLWGAMTGKHRALSPDELKTLSDRMISSKDGKVTGLLADEMSRTKPGKELLGFYDTPRASGQNALDFGIEEFSGGKKDFSGFCTYGGASPQIRLNEKMVYDYARRKGISASEILKSEEHMAGLAVYLAPTFVHEATHQRQEALEREKFPALMGTSAAYRTIEREAEAFAMGAAQAAEGLEKGGPKYLTNANPYDVRDAEIYLEGGVDALRARKHTFDSYNVIDHVEESAAARLLAYSAANERKAAELKAKRDEDPDSLTAQERKDLAFYQEFQRQAYAAASYRRKKAMADERKIIGWRDELLNEDNGVKPSFVPPPGA